MTTTTDHDPDTPLLVPLPGGDELAQRLADGGVGQLAALTRRRFPDGEWYVRYDTQPADRDVVLVGSLGGTDAQLLPLLFLSGAARELGARSIGLVAPYLGYLRHDAVFEPGEAVTARLFASTISRSVDWLATVDPHLHRLESLADVYSIPAEALSCARWIARWLRTQVERPLLIGPDEESAQWVQAVAELADAPWVVLEKTRRGDRDVEVTALPDHVDSTRSPVLLDDIVSTGRTMLEGVRAIRAAGLGRPVCIAIHAVFADDITETLVDAGAERVASCNTLKHATNVIDVTQLLAGALQDFPRLARSS